MTSRLDVRRGSVPRCVRSPRLEGIPYAQSKYASLRAQLLIMIRRPSRTAIGAYPSRRLSALTGPAAVADREVGPLVADSTAVNAGNRGPRTPKIAESIARQ